MKKVGYYCGICHEATIVVDHSDKPLPKTIKCGAIGGCHTGTATLSDQPFPPTIVATHKTYPPTADDIAKQPELQQHAEAGGVFVRSKRE